MRQMMMYISLVLGFMIVMNSQPVLAQDSSLNPPLPEGIKGLVDKGAQIKYLGREHGLDGWIMVYKGQEQYFYVTPDGQGFVTGLLFDQNGEPATVRQVRDLQQSGNAGILESLVERSPDFGQNTDNALRQQQEAIAKQQQSPSEQLFDDVSGGNWVAFGGREAPVAYAFIDPTCPHCHDFVNELREGYLDQGRVQLRVLPVSRFTDDEQVFQKAAYMLASPQPEQDFYAHLDGNENALPTGGNLNTQAIQQNMAVMQKWQLDAIPFVVYRAKNGDVKIIRGKVKDPNILINDLDPSKG